MIWRSAIIIVSLLLILLQGGAFMSNINDSVCNVDPSDPSMAKYLPGTIVLETCPPKISDYIIPVALFLITAIVGWLTIKKHPWLSVIFPLGMVVLSVALEIMTRHL